MAKTTTCKFCNKELTKGFFNGNANSLEVAPLVYVTCCDECEKELRDVAKQESERFGVKLANLKRATKSKPTQEEIGKMYLKYLDEKDVHLSKPFVALPIEFEGFCCIGAGGSFCVKEFEQGFINSDASAKLMVKSKEKAAEEGTLLSRYFTKEDITRIEYRRVGIGDPLGLCNIAYSYEIRLNDEKDVTYKPCITRAAVLGKGFLGFFCKKSAKRQIQAMLERFKEHIGSDLPIREVKSFN